MLKQSRQFHVFSVVALFITLLMIPGHLATVFANAATSENDIQVSLDATKQLSLADQLQRQSAEQKARQQALAKANAIVAEQLAVQKKQEEERKKAQEAAQRAAKEAAKVAEQKAEQKAQKQETSGINKGTFKVTFYDPAVLGSNMGYSGIAANLSILPRGTRVKITLSDGQVLYRVVNDTGTFAYSNPYQIDVAMPNSQIPAAGVMSAQVEIL